MHNLAFLYFKDTRSIYILPRNFEIFPSLEISTDKHILLPCLFNIDGLKSHALDCDSITYGDCQNAKTSHCNHRYIYVNSLVIHTRCEN